MRTTIARHENIKDPSRPWCLQWQSDAMPGPAFWYYETREEAERDEAALKAGRSK